MFSSDSFVEQVVKKGKPMPYYYAKLVVAIVLVIISEAMIFLFGRLVTGPVIFIIAVYLFLIIIQYGNVEYEYTFTNGSVEIAGIYKASKRREFLHFDMDQVVMIAPADSEQIAAESFHRKSYFGSKQGSNTQIAMLVDVNKRRELVILEPDERSMEHIRLFGRNKCQGFGIGAGRQG